MKELLNFINRVEGDGYGGMAEYEIARQQATDLCAKVGEFVAAWDWWQVDPVDRSQPDISDLRALVATSSDMGRIGT